jgi:hypothetical protein
MFLGAYMFQPNAFSRYLAFSAVAAIVAWAMLVPAWISPAIFVWIMLAVLTTGAAALVVRRGRFPRSVAQVLYVVEHPPERQS